VVAYLSGTLVGLGHDQPPDPLRGLWQQPRPDRDDHQHRHRP
jgi:hypothetical protein